MGIPVRVSQTTTHDKLSLILAWAGAIVHSARRLCLPRRSESQTRGARGPQWAGRCNWSVFYFKGGKAQTRVGHAALSC